MYEKQNWNQYDESKTVEENIKMHAVATADYMNHVETGIYDASKPLVIGEVVEGEDASATIVDAAAEKKLNLVLPKGDIGLTGPKGDKGDKGDKGADGAKGEKGDIGPIGPKGDEGDKGDSGKSAYQTAVDNGFTGTETEWLASIGASTTLSGNWKSSDKIITDGAAFPSGTPGDLVIDGNGDLFIVQDDNTVKKTTINLKGPKGDPGVKGDAGIAGPKGDKGDPGEVGPKGDKGDPGEIGPKGADGLNGSDGVKGDKGDAGEIGPAGPKGDTGEVGPKGDIGLTGPKGDTGSIGPKGADGLKGDTGEAGPKGADGAAGPKGDTGEVGPKGDKGDTGSSSEILLLSEPVIDGSEIRPGVRPNDITIDSNADVFNVVDNKYHKTSNLKGPKGDKGDPGSGTGGSMDLRIGTITSGATPGAAIRTEGDITYIDITFPIVPKLPVVVETNIVLKASDWVEVTTNKYTQTVDVPSATNDNTIDVTDGPDITPEMISEMNICKIIATTQAPGKLTFSASALAEIDIQLHIKTTTEQV